MSLYFLAASWLPRALAAQKDQSVVADWWGRDDWQLLRAMKDHARAELVCERFRDELGYRSALAWPIRSKEHGGRVHYHMVHASDHLEAPKLMHRAYHKAVTSKSHRSSWVFRFNYTRLAELELEIVKRRRDE